MSPRDRLLPPRVTSAELAGFMTGHEDPRVRWAAHACHLAWLRRASSLTAGDSPVPLELAHNAMDADDDPAVRAVCVDIALAAAVAAADAEDPDATTSVVSSEGVADADAIDAGDAAFRRLAGAMQDASPLVRVRAARALGRLAGRVSEAELAATLDRQVMTDLRLRRRPNDLQAQQRQRDRRAGAPIGDVELKDVTLLSLGSSGAFVNGFEDESSAVRAAAVRSAGRLAERCPAFADQCADVLVDMLADDIHAVRLAAVRALARLADFQLAGPQLHVCLAALKEDNAELRRGLRDLLAGCGLADTDCLRTLLAGLLDNLARYPADRHCVWRCSAAVGRRHSGLLQLAIADLLCLHPYLQGAEPMKEDPAYTAVLLAVLNATARLPQLRALLPPYAKRHYAYMRAALPSLTPALPALASAPPITAAVSVNNEEFFAATLAKVRAELQSAASGRRRLRPLLADLARLARLTPALAGRAAFAHDWCRLAAALASPTSSSTCPDAVAITYRLQLLYSGQHAETVDCLVRLRRQIAASSSSGVTLPTPPLLPDPLPAGLGRFSAALLEPTTLSGVEENRRFPAGLPLPVPVRARLRHCPRPDRVRVWLRLPDRRRVVWAPADAHWTEIDASDGVYELSTQLQVTCPQWTDAAQLQVCLAIELDDWSAEVTPCVPVNVQPQPPRRS
ncbi:hypothetical protein BOX15_Mlig013776g2 [Macrostomum lignano]|nr:hypothetical protein BOX15_Mlig013776g2 [Macrostomum lignano]